MTDNTSGTADGSVPSAPKDRMQELDGLRAIAILLVIAFHSWYFLSGAFTTKELFAGFAASIPDALAFVRRGDVGVDIFFVLSSFLLSYQLFGQRKSTGTLKFKRFFAHRIARIYPLYIVALAIAFAAGEPLRLIIGNLLAYNIWTHPDQIVIPWSWSLSVELNFYLAVPFLILLIRSGRALATLAVLICLVSAGWSHWYVANSRLLGTDTLMELWMAGDDAEMDYYWQFLYVAFPVRAGQFVFGIVAAWLVVYRADWFRGLGAGTTALMVVLALAGIAAPLMNNTFVPQTEWNQFWMNFEYRFGRMSFAAGVAMLILLMQTGQISALKRGLSAQLWQPVARYSYSMYLFHPLFVGLAAKLILGREDVDRVAPVFVAAIFVSAVAGAMALGWITWRVIERPALRFARRRFG